VPGGGRGHDAILLAQRGLDVDLVDFAPAALEAAASLAAGAGAVIHTHLQDYFSLPGMPYHRERYDLIWEYTFFCAIDPSLRKAYAQAALNLLKPGGLLVGLFFPLESDKPGPPFLVSRDEVRELFSSFSEGRIEEPQRSVKPRAGREFPRLLPEVVRASRPERSG
jgi:SAM-dependent methyltransferase